MQEMLGANADVEMPAAIEGSAEPEISAQSVRVPILMIAMSTDSLPLI
jgi:hypothetical protein